MKKEIFLVIILIVLAVLSRTFFHINNNVEFITAFVLVSAYYFNDIRYSLITLFGSIVISDIIIGNSLIFLFTWSGFLFTLIIGRFLRFSKFKSPILSGLFGGVLGTFIFFFWTNFGVVVLGSMYTPDINGLIQSYINGIPFLLNQLVGNVFIVPLVFTIFNLIYISESTNFINRMFRKLFFLFNNK